MPANVVQLSTDRRLIEDHIRHVGYMKQMLFGLDLEKNMDGVALYAVIKLGEEIDALLRCYSEEIPAPA